MSRSSDASQPADRDQHEQHTSSSQSCTAATDSFSQQQLRDIHMAEDALSGVPVASEPRRCQSQTQPRLTPLTGREKRFKDIEDGLAGIEVFSSQSQTPSSLTGREKRFKDIEDGLAGRDIVPSETRLLSQCQSQASSSLKGHEKRLKDIEDALLEMKTSGTIQTNDATVRLGVPDLKRASCSTPESPPRAKRRQLSPKLPALLLLPSKAVEDALLEMKPSSQAETTRTNVSTVSVPNLKRTSCLTPDSPPRAKRRRLSPKLPASSPLPSPATTSFGSSSGSLANTATTSLEPSLEPEPIVTLLPDKVRGNTYSMIL